VKPERTVSANRDDEYFRKWEAYLRIWKRRTIGLGIALILSIVSVVPFLDGHFLHRYFEQGRYLIYLSCGLLTLFVGASGLTYNFWSYCRSLRAKDKSADSHRI
jgi:hypothetical protein